MIAIIKLSTGSIDKKLSKIKLSIGNDFKQ